MYLYVIFTCISLLAAIALFYALYPNRGRCMVAVAVFVAASLGLYSVVGSPQVIALLDQHEARMQQAQQVIAIESAAVKKEPSNLESWIRLGQAWADCGQWPQATGAFKRAVLLSGGQPDLIMAYARSMIMEQDGEVSDHAKESLDMVLMQVPQHEEARYYMAVHTLQEGRTNQAMQQMKALYQSLPEDSPVRGLIDRQIGRN